MLQEMLSSDNPLVRYGIAAFAVFAPLYILSSFGFRWAWVIAVLIFIGVIIKVVGSGNASFRPGGSVA